MRFFRLDCNREFILCECGHDLLSTKDMGRNRSERWGIFQKVNTPFVMKIMPANYIFCNQNLSETSTNMDSYFRYCRRIKMSVGSLIDSTTVQTRTCIDMRNDGISEKTSTISIENDTVEIDPSMVAIHNVLINYSSQKPNKVRDRNANNDMRHCVLRKTVTNASNATQREKPNKIFACAVHEIANPFSFSVHASWKQFFIELNPYCRRRPNT